MPNVKRCLGTAAVCLLIGAPQAAAAKWVEVKSPNFTVYSDAGAKEAGRVAFQFEQVRAVFQALWPEARTRSPRPILILATRDEGGFKALLPEFWQRKDGTRPAGYSTRGSDKYYLALRSDVADEFQQNHNPYYLLYKVYLRVLFDLNLSGMPPWLSQGLLEFFGATIVEADRVLVAKPLRWQLEHLRERALLPLPRLLAVAPGAPELTTELGRDLFDAQAWALIHMLYTDPSGAGGRSLGALLGALRRGVDPERATHEALGDLGALDKRLQSYVRRAAFQYGRLKLDARIKADDFPTRELSPAEALAVHGDFHAHRGQEALARPLLDQALQQDPKLALAHEAQGYLTWHEKSLAEALPSFKRAVESGGGFLPHFLLATALLEQDTPEALEQAQAALTKAVELNPEHARAHEALARALGRREVELGRAVELAQRAVALEPLDADQRVTLSWLLEKAGRRDDAQAEARRAVAVARGDVERQRARTWLDTLSRHASQAASPRTAQAAAPAARSSRPPAEQEQACAAGQLAECFALGDRHASGDGVSADPARARDLYQRACDGGLADACLALVGAHLAGTLGARDPAAAVSAMGRACDAGHALSCAHAGLMLSTASEVARDDTRAAGFLKKGCEAEVATACGGLALLHLGGRGGLTRDVLRAAALLEQACGAGEPSSCANLAGLHEAGVGVARNAARARELYAAACAKGLPNACAKAGARPQ